MLEAIPELLSIVFWVCVVVWMAGSFSSSQQEDKDRETPKDSLDDLFPNDEEEQGQGS